LLQGLLTDDDDVAVVSHWIPQWWRSISTVPSPSTVFTLFNVIIMLSTSTLTLHTLINFNLMRRWRFVSDVFFVALLACISLTNPTIVASSYLLGAFVVVVVRCQLLYHSAPAGEKRAVVDASCRNDNETKGSAGWLVSSKTHRKVRMQQGKFCLAYSVVLLLAVTCYRAASYALGFDDDEHPPLWVTTVGFGSEVSLQLLQLLY
jgi:hypothetical protein